MYGLYKYIKKYILIKDRILDKAIEAPDNLRKYYEGDKEQIRVSIQYVNRR